MEDRLKVTASGRYDKAQNFKEMFLQDYPYLMQQEKTEITILELLYKLDLETQPLKINILV